MILWLMLTLTASPNVSQMHIPKIGVDTAGTYLTRNKEYGGLGWEFPAFRAALDDLGAEFLVDHYLEIRTGGSYEQNQKETVEDIKALAAYLKADGKEYIWNLEDANFRISREYVPGQNLYEPEPGLHYLKIPDDLLRELQKTPEILGVCYDELEHMQLSNNRFTMTSSGDIPSIADTSGLTLAEAYSLLVENLKKLKTHYDAVDKLCMVENVWPVMQHIFARAGWTLSPKLLKESWIPVPLAMVLGAAAEYEKTGCDVWLTPDLWFRGNYPGHSVEELRSALLVGHWVGASRIYVENLDYSNPVEGKHHADAHDIQGSLVFFTGKDKYETTPYGEIFKWYARDYRSKHPVPYTWRDARCKVAIIRFPDSCWGQKGSYFRDRLLGSKIEQSTLETEAWFSIWNQLSLGTIPEAGLSFHCKGVSGEKGPRFFCPSPPVLVFDHRVGDEIPDFDFRGAEVLFLTGVQISPKTLSAVQSYVERTGATAVMLKSLAPDGFKSSTRFFTVDSFKDPRVHDVLKPLLPPADEMQFLFGKYQIIFKEIDRDRIQVFLDGKPVSPIIKPNTNASCGPNGES
ncbi:MAG: hypothetical protein K9L89_00445 [Kiritimatiellales bacterium]|nr:hypothetical protein [Kiritimatiellales bacterium]